MPISNRRGCCTSRQNSGRALITTVETNLWPCDRPQLQCQRRDDFEADIMSIEKDDSDRGNPATWIDDGEKYALIGLSAKVEEYIPFNIPPHWRDWLGS